MDLGLTGKVALITGGSEGIGKAAGLSMAAEGAKVAICARRPDVLDQAAAEIREATGGEVLAISTDVSDSAAVEALVARVVSEFGRLDILVNNAGASAAGPFESVSDEGWHDDLELKLYGAIRACRLALPHMRAQGGGRIINVTNLGAKAPGAASVPTSVSRAAGVALTKAMSKEYASDNILVNTVCIGLIKSAQWERRYEQAKAQDASVTQDSIYASMGQNVPLKRVGESAEAGDVIAFLASERASYLTGIAVNIDGGTSPVV
ncbi:MAG: SDR family oxidoreductase [SAR202 cluster bacterium]|jgi:NAD(P)-dependent dehydrogenase (short-subunit alcohol dehydrogenase family)|nr:short-chain dehydrogenase [Chloroflexota bacterium]MDP6420264.1 SDR family oxidoreductase [SAR202 cluster bacterium]HAL47786.1 short-chain dehydrogenase [Dehalococcoidia bacterium]MDP6664979.1 SDR family oxidoreductase [SAR202 cluster bacterium]MQG58497.1 SDR family oxidoreductase [SAR202 cluster bacterium]|tara:strand:+ start:26967 stop:27758 length:792 start_codon:yes stop_codon:yes gene_type:complete